MKKTEEKKTPVKTTSKPDTAEKKPVVKTTKKATPAAVKKAPAKTASKTTAKTAKSTKTSAKKAVPASKKTSRKPKPITIDNICKLIEKKVVKANAAKIKDTLAVDIEVWGFEDGSNQKMYIEVKDGKVNVMPHSYDAKDFRVSLSFANAMDFANGKITLAKLLESNDFYAEGNIVSAIKLAAIF